MRFVQRIITIEAGPGQTTERAHDQVDKNYEGEELEFAHGFVDWVNDMYQARQAQIRQDASAAEMEEEY